jgi:hypothetical protein
MEPSSTGMKLFIRNSTLHRIFSLVIIQHNNHRKSYQQLRVYKQLPTPFSVKSPSLFYLSNTTLTFQASRTTTTYPTWKDDALQRVWWVALGWSAAEAMVGVKQGYGSIALYGGVLVNVIMSSTLNTEMGSKETPEAPKR